MPTIRVAVALPDCSSLLRDVRLWLREFEQVKLELTKEQAELEGTRLET